MMIVMLVIVASSCGDPTDRPGVQIVVTTSVLGDLVSNLVGDRAEVEVLMPIGVDPHEFQASPDQVARVHRADLVVAFGLGLESGLADVLSAAVSDGANLLELGPDLDPLPLPEAEGHGHEHELDPHIWMDPVRMAAGVEVVVEALEELEPATD
jgi:zinc/manganese transport system substrate-binding protein